MKKSTEALIFASNETGIELNADIHIGWTPVYRFFGILLKLN